MHRRVLSAVMFVLMMSLLGACASRSQAVDDIPRSFDIRAVAVTGSGNVPPVVLRNTQNQLTRAIRGTARPIPMPHAVMKVRIDALVPGTTYEGFTSDISVNVILADVDSGLTILNHNLAIKAFAFDENGLNNAIVEAIVSRLRLVYGLSQPVLREPIHVQPRISTRMATDRPGESSLDASAPVVVPLGTVQRIGTDQDPLLNSKTKVAPVEKPAQAVILPGAKLKTGNAAPAGNELESGARAKVTLTPKPAPSAQSDDEPCVETMDKKC